MKIFAGFFILFLFLGELVLDSSTPFVRSGVKLTTVTFVKTSDSRSSSASGAEKNKSTPGLTLEYSAHSALPLSPVVETLFVLEKAVQNHFCPELNYKDPVISRIERPPIS